MQSLVELNIIEMHGAGVKIIEDCILSRLNRILTHPPFAINIQRNFGIPSKNNVIVFSVQGFPMSERALLCSKVPGFALSSFR